MTMVLDVRHHSSLGSRSVPWFDKGLSMPSPSEPVLLCPLPYRVAPVFVQVVTSPLGWSPLSYFLGETRGPSVVFGAVDMPCPGPFNCSHIADYIYDFCPTKRCYFIYHATASGFVIAILICFIINPSKEVTK